MPYPQKATDDQIVEAYIALASCAKVADSLGMCSQSVHERLGRLGLLNRVNVFSQMEEDRLVRDYEAYASCGRLDHLAREMNRTKHFLARQARSLGLTRSRRSRPWASGEAGSLRVKEAQIRTGHPRGMLGKTKVAAESMSESERAKHRWSSVTRDEQADRTLKGMKTKVQRYGSVAPGVARGTWKAAWREIGGKRKFFRSKWEANYARYLEWLKERGVISDWQHEPETFWFDNIKRGVRSYLPDFRVWLPNGKTELHEVKGWMDSRSRTTISRMAKYHPTETLIVIDKKQYASILSQASALIPDWE